MVVFIVKLALLGLLIYAAFKAIWKAVCAACEELINLTIDLVGKIKVAVRRGSKAIFILYRQYVDGRKTKTQVGTEEDVDVLPDELNELLQEKEQVIVKDEVSGW